MVAVSLKKEIIEEVKILPEKNLEMIAEFIDFIRDREIEEDILSNKKLSREIRKSRKDWETGKTVNFINWNDLKKKYGI